MDKDKILYAEKLYSSGCKEDAYNYIKANDINIIEGELLSFLHMEYCMDKGYYEEALNLKDNFLKIHPKSKYISSIGKLFKDDEYEKKAKKYNKKRWSEYSGECCCDCCCDIDAFDACIDCGPGDIGCIDIDLCCFCDC